MVLFGSERASRRLAKVARLTPTDMLHLICLKNNSSCGALWRACRLVGSSLEV